MIAIPNMEKPKSCYNHCEFIAMEEVGCPLKDYAESHQYKDRIHPDCPLIDIVQCNDCKYGHKHILKDTYDCYKSDITVFHEADFFCKASERSDR